MRCRRWVCHASGGLIANHLPFHLDRDQGEFGTARVIDNRDWLLGLLTRLTGVHASGQPTPWRVSVVPSADTDRLLRAIVGIEIPIDRLEARLKASHDEAMPARPGDGARLAQDAMRGSNPDGGPREPNHQRRRE